MSNQHSVIEHRANYFFLKLEEDYIAIFPEEDKHRHCKASILSILEHWMNSKRTETSGDCDGYVYLSYPQFSKQMFELFGRSTVIRCMKELVIEGLVLSHPYVDTFNQKTFAYMLNVEAINALLRALPKRKGSVKVNGGSVKVNDPSSKVNGGSFKNELPSFKNERNIDYIDSNTDSPQTHKEGEDVATSSEDRNAPANVYDFEQKKTESAKLKAVSLQIATDYKKDSEAIVIPPRLTLQQKEQTSPTRDTDTPVQHSGAHPEPSPIRADAAQGDRPPMALSAKEIGAQEKKREKELWAIIETELGTKYSANQRKLQKDGIALLIADDISDETIQEGLRALNTFERRTFSVYKFYGWLPNLGAKRIPFKAAANGDVAPQDEDYSDFDIYKGNGKEERAARLALYDVMEANGELI